MSETVRRHSFLNALGILLQYGDLCWFRDVRLGIAMVKWVTDRPEVSRWWFISYSFLREWPGHSRLPFRLKTVLTRNSIWPKLHWEQFVLLAPKRRIVIKYENLLTYPFLSLAHQLWSRNLTVNTRLSIKRFIDARSNSFTPDLRRLGLTVTATLNMTLARNVKLSSAQLEWLTDHGSAEPVILPISVDD